MITYGSLDDVRTRLRIAESDPDRIRTAILTRLRSLHPDTLLGREQTKMESERVLELTEALNYLDALDRERALIPREGITSLVEVIKALVPANIAQQRDVEFAAKVDATVAGLRPKNALPRITLAGISALLSALWLFPSAASQHPVLKDWVHADNPGFAVVWLMAISLTTWSWLWSYQQRDRQVRFLAHLKLERTQNLLFERFLETSGVGHGDRFNKTGFISFVEDLPGQHNRPLLPFLPFRPRRLDPSISEELAATILSRALSRHVIGQEETLSLDDSYVLNHPLPKGDRAHDA